MGNYRGARKTTFGFPAREAPSQLTAARVTPTLGWTPIPEQLAPLGSTTSGQNFWIRDGRLQLRERYALYGTTNLLQDAATGAWTYLSSNGTEYPMAASQSTIVYHTGSDWTHLRYSTSPTDDALSGTSQNAVFATSAYLPRLDANVMLAVNGKDRPFVWQGPDRATGSGDTNAYSTLSGSPPIATDITYYDLRPVLWNTQDPSTSTRYVTRMQWPVRGDAEDWTGIGSGQEDLVEMRGTGTRIFAMGNRFLLASDRELWIAAEQEAPWVFQYTPLTKEYGMPFPRAALQIPQGVVWLNNDYMVYLFDGQQISPIGAAIHRKLRATLKTFGTVTFGYHAGTRQVTLYYENATQQRGFTYNFDNQTWMPQQYPAYQTATFAPIVSNARTEGFISSNGTAYSFSTSALTDSGTTMSADLVLPGFFSDTPDRSKYVDEWRLNYTTNSASSLSVSISMDGGASYTYDAKDALKSSSDVTQLKIYPNISGLYGTLRLQCEDQGTWELQDFYIRARVQGEGF